MSKNNHLTEGLERENIKPARISFSIGPNGKVYKVQIDQSCGHPKIDDNLKELIMQTSGLWTPATDYPGKKVEQVLTFNYGMMGC